MFFRGMICSVFAASALFGLSALSAVPAKAGYPDHPVTMIVPFSAGGASDVLARMVQRRLSKALGQNVVIENKAGAGGNIGVDTVIQSEPDGYTILLGNVGAIAINPHIYPDMVFDPLTDLQPVTQLVALPSVLIINPDRPITSVEELVSFAKENPEELSFASPGSASLARLQMEIFRLKEDLNMVHVPHSGGAGPAMAAVLAGHIPLGFSSLPSAIGHIKEGRLRALAVTSDERQAILPNVPTMKELGYPENRSSAWQGVFVPKDTPREVIDILRSALVETVSDPAISKRLEEAASFVAISESPDAFGEFVRSESEKWGAAIEKTGTVAE